VGYKQKQSDVMKGPKMAKEIRKFERGAEAEAEARDFLKVGGKWETNSAVIRSAVHSRGLNLLTWFEHFGISPFTGARLIIDREESQIALLHIVNEIPEKTAEGQVLIEKAYAKIFRLSREDSKMNAGEFLSEFDNAAVLEEVNNSYNKDLIKLLIGLGIDDPIGCFHTIVKRAEDPGILFALTRYGFNNLFFEEAYGKIKRLIAADKSARDPAAFLSQYNTWGILNAIESSEIDLCSWLIKNGMGPFSAVKIIIRRANDLRTLSRLIFGHMGGIPKKWQSEIDNEIVERRQIVHSRKSSIEESDTEAKARAFLDKEGQWRDNHSIRMACQENGMNLSDWFEKNGIDPIIGAMLMIDRTNSPIDLFHLADDFSNVKSEGSRLVSITYTKASQICRGRSKRISKEILSEISNPEILEAVCRFTSWNLIKWIILTMRIGDPINCIQKIIDRAEDPVVLFEMMCNDAPMLLIHEVRKKIDYLLVEDKDSPNLFNFLDQHTNDQIREAVESEGISFGSWLIRAKVNPFDVVRVMIQREEDSWGIVPLVHRWTQGFPRKLAKELRTTAFEKSKMMADLADSQNDKTNKESVQGIVTSDGGSIGSGDPDERAVWDLDAVNSVEVTSGIDEEDEEESSEIVPADEVILVREGPAESKARFFLGRNKWGNNRFILHGYRNSSHLNLISWFSGKDIHPIIAVGLMIEREKDIGLLIGIANEIPERSATGQALIEEAYKRIVDITQEEHATQSAEEVLSEFNNRQILDKLADNEVFSSRISLLYWLVEMKCVDDLFRAFRAIIKRAEDPVVLFELIRQDRAMPLVKEARRKIKNLLVSQDAPEPAKFLEEFTNKKILEAVKSKLGDATEVNLCSWLIQRAIEPIGAIAMIIDRAKDMQVLVELTSVWIGNLPPGWESEIHKVVLAKRANFFYPKSKQNVPDQDDSGGTRIVADDLAPEVSSDDDRDPIPLVDKKPEPVIAMTDLLMPGELLSDVEEKKAKQKSKRKSARKEAK
jgi:hypothetical protein